jgi:hypothetical protein
LGVPGFFQEDQSFTARNSHGFVFVCNENGQLQMSRPFAYSVVQPSLLVPASPDLEPVWLVRERALSVRMWSRAVWLCLLTACCHRPPK